MAGIAIASVAKHRAHPIRFLDSIDYIETCRATVIVRSGEVNGTFSPLLESFVFDREMGTTTRASRGGVTERVKVDDGVNQTRFAAGDEVQTNESLHSLDRLKKKLQIEKIRRENWDVVYSKVISSDGPRFHRRYLLRSDGPLQKELVLTVSGDNRLTNLQLRQSVQASRPTSEAVFAVFDVPIERSWFVADHTNPIFIW